MKKPVRILQVVTIMNQGGIETFLMSLYRNLDHSKVQFDFLVHRKERGKFDDEIEAFGGYIYRFNPIRPHQYFSYKANLESFFKQNKEYQVIHSHINENSAIILNIAKKYNIPVRIAHSHAKATAGPFKFIRRLLKLGIPYFSTTNIACSRDAGVWLFGSSDFRVFKNSIDTNKFKFPYNFTPIQELKKKIGLEKDDFVIGSIARFSPTKNHSFMIDIFKDFYKINNKSKLLLVGDGTLKETIFKKVKDLNLEKVVIFIGNVDNPENYLSVMDLFLMTSFNEGFPVVLLESQSNGLPILMSDTMPKEIEITNLTKRMSLDKTPTEWSLMIEEIRKLNLRGINQGYDEIVKRNGYDVKDNIQELLKIYKIRV